MTALTPFESLYEPKQRAGASLPLSSELRNLYGLLTFPLHPGRSYLVANFVETLDGVVSLGIPGRSGGGEISGFNLHDRMLMGLLRAMADVVIVGAGTLRSVPHHLWTAAYIFPDLAREYQAFRNALGKPGPPLNVIITASGEIDLCLRVFQSGEVPVLIVTTPAGEKKIRQRHLPPSVQVVALNESDSQLGARAILAAVQNLRESDVILVEGGPQLMGRFFAEKCLDELFLTFSPQVAGRDDTPPPGTQAAERPGFVAGTIFAPGQPVWGTLTGVKRAGSHLFLRYSFNEA